MSDEVSFDGNLPSSDDEVLAAAREMMPQPKPERSAASSDLGTMLTNGPGPSWVPGWWPLAAACVLMLIVGIGLGRVGDSDSVATAAPAGKMSEPIPVQQLTYPDGASTDQGLYAWPGQPLTAPAPQQGKAVGWQWETCDGVPDRPSPDRPTTTTTVVDDGCEAVPDATGERWTSPPVDEATQIRVIVDVEMSKGSTPLPFASQTVQARPFPDGYTPGDPVPTTTTDAPTTTEATTTTAKAKTKTTTKKKEK